MSLRETEMLAWLKSRGCRVGAVTVGEKGLLWYEGDGRRSTCPLCTCPWKRSSTPPAPATSSTAPIAPPISSDPSAPWRDHFEFARAASAHKVQHLGNEAGLPSNSDIALARRHLASVS